MAIGDTLNQNPFGTNYNAEEEERKKAELAAQGAMMGAGNIPASAFGQEPNPTTFLPYADDVAPPPASALSVFTPGGEVKPNVDVNAITPSPDVNAEANPQPPLNNALLEMLERGDERQSMGLPRQAALGIIDAPVETPPVGAQEQSTQSVGIPQGAEGSPQANFASRMSSGEPLTQEEITAANAFAKSMGTTFNPETGYSRDAFLGSQPTAPRSDTFPNDPGVQRTRDELMRRFGAPTIREIQEQDAIRAGRMTQQQMRDAYNTAGRQAGTNLTPPPLRDFAPQVAGGGNAVGLPILESNPVPMPGTRPGDKNPSQGDPGFIQQPSLRDPDPGFSQRPPSLRDPDKGFIRPAPNLSDFERDSLAREARLDARPGFNEVRRDRDRRDGGLSQADARDLAQGMDPNASEGQRMRALEIQSRLGLGQFKPEKELSDLEKREIESRIRGRDADIAAQEAAQERKGSFAPQIVEIGDQKLIQLSPNYYQPVRPEPTAEEPFEPRVLEEGGFTYYEVAPNRFERQPSTKAGGATGEVSSAIADAIAAGGEEAATTPDATSISSAPVRINSQAEYDALPVGTPYIDSQGTETFKK